MAVNGSSWGVMTMNDIQYNVNGLINKKNFTGDWCMNNNVVYISWLEASSIYSNMEKKRGGGDYRVT